MACGGCGKAAHGAAGLVRAAVAVTTGIGGVPLEVLNDRVRACKSCEHYGVGWTCAKCGCVLAAKLKLAAEACPIGKWDSLSD